MIDLRSGRLRLDTMDLRISVKAEGGPLSLLGGRVFPPTLTFHQSHKAVKEAVILEVNVVIFDCDFLFFVNLLLVNDSVLATVPCSTRGAIYVIGLEIYLKTNHAKYQVS